MVNVLIFIVVGYIVYRLVMIRIRWRTIRLLMYVPLLAFVAFAIRFGEAVSIVRSVPTSDEVAAQIVDEDEVRRGDLIVAVTGSGAIQPMRKVPLTFGTIGQVAEVNAVAGTHVEQGGIIARLDTSDFTQVLDTARIALEVQQSAYEALTSPSRQVDIAGAEAALAAAQAQYYAAASTAPTTQQEEIARLQFELAKNQNYQLQLQRDAVTIPDVSDFTITIDGIPQVDGSTLPPEAQDAVNFVNDQIEGLNGSINESLSQLTGANAQAQIQQLEAQRQQLESGLDETETNAQIAEQRYAATVSRGPDSGAVSAANASIVQAQVALDRLLNGASEDELASADLNIKLAENALAQAEQSLTNTVLTAPFGGVVVENNLTIGELPPQGVAVLLMDTSSYLIDLPIDETDVVKIAIGQRVTVAVDALPDALVTGVVTRVAYTPVKIGQLVTYNVRVALDPSDVPLRVAMSVTANIITEEQSNTLIVRNRFIRIDPITQNAFVTVENADGTFIETLVILGKRNDLESEILNGLAEGQKVILLPRGTEGVGGFFG